MPRMREGSPKNGLNCPFSHRSIKAQVMSDSACSHATTSFFKCLNNGQLQSVYRVSQFVFVFSHRIQGGLLTRNEASSNIIRCFESAYQSLHSFFFPACIASPRSNLRRKCRVWLRHILPPCQRQTSNVARLRKQEKLLILPFTQSELLQKENGLLSKYPSPRQLLK